MDIFLLIIKTLLFPGWHSAERPQAETRHLAQVGRVSRVKQDPPGPRQAETHSPLVGPGLVDHFVFRCLIHTWIF